MANTGKEQGEMARISEQIISLIVDQHFEQAAALIENARQSLPESEMHRLTALSAVLQKQIGNLSDSIDLIRLAHRENPTWIPHLYRLSVYLMEAERWFDANAALDELISLSEKNNDRYFLDEARLRKIFCLKELGHQQEIQRLKNMISVDATAFIGDRLYGLADFD